MKKEYRNVTRTKKAIRSAFADLVSEKKDLYKITVTELVERADIAKSTFYLHYDDIFSVAEEFENNLISTLKSIIDNTEENIYSFEKSFHMILLYLKHNEKLYTKLINSSQSMYFIDKLKKVLTLYLFNNITTNNLSTDPHIKNAQIRFLTNGAIDLVLDYFRGNTDVSLDEIKNIVIDFLKAYK